MPPAAQIRAFDRTCADYDVCEKAALILEHAHLSSQAILKAFNLAREERSGAPGGLTVGMTTDEEQDLLRATLVMAAAGLDAMAKQLVRDALPFVVHDNELAREGLESFIARRFAKDLETLHDGRRAKFVPELIASSNLQERVVDAYIGSLTDRSLQSADELRRVAAAFGLTSDDIDTDFLELREIFVVRNRIIHELDVNLSAPRRNRNVRRKGELVRSANLLLSAGQDLLVAVDQQVATCQGE